MHANALPPPRPHRVTTQEFFRMGEAGVLDPEARIELVEGEMIDMPPIAPPHAGRTTRLTLLLIEAIGRRAVVSTQNPILLGDLSAPQPDIAILEPRDEFYSSEHPQAEEYFWSSRSPTAASATTASENCRCTPATASPRSGSSTSRRAPSGSTEPPRTAPTEVPPSSARRIGSAPRCSTAWNWSLAHW
jgi:hypothetical protein